MHYWRLPLLLFLAVFEPIAAFNERNLIDGRDQCSELPNQDHRLAHGPQSKSDERRLNYRVENRRNEIRVDRYLLERPSFERRLANAHSEIRVRENTTPRFERTGYRQEIEFQHRDDHTLLHGTENRIQRAQQTKNEERNHENIRERYTRNVQDDRVSRKLSTRESSQEIRREQRTRNARDTRMDSRRYQDVVEKRRRILETRETRNLLQRTRDDVAHRSFERSDRRDFRETNNAREMTTEQRSRSESRRYNDMERRKDQRARDLAELRRFESKSVEVRDIRNNDRMNHRNVRDERRSVISRNDDGKIYRRRQLDERVSRDRTMQLRREYTQRSRNLEDMRVRLQQRGSRNDARRFVEEFRGNNRNKDLMDARSENRREVRSVRRDIGERRHLDVTREVKVTVRAQNKQENNLDRIKLNSRFPMNTRVAVSREVVFTVEKGEPLNESGKSYINWQYIFYGLQAVYLCGILGTMLDRSGSGKIKSRSLWWNTPSQKLLKVD